MNKKVKKKKMKRASERRRGLPPHHAAARPGLGQLSPSRCTLLPPPPHLSSFLPFPFLSFFAVVSSFLSFLSPFVYTTTYKQCDCDCVIDWMNGLCVVKFRPLSLSLSPFIHLLLLLLLPPFILVCRRIRDTASERGVFGVRHIPAAVVENKAKASFEGIGFFMLSSLEVGSEEGRTLVAFRLRRCAPKKFFFGCLPFRHSKEAAPCTIVDFPF